MDMDTNEQAPPEFGVRVFLVEDNPEHSFIAVTVIRQVLGDASEVIVAENADEAVELIQQFTDTDRPDLMLVDLRLPDNGGFAVLSAARAAAGQTRRGFQSAANSPRWPQLHPGSSPRCAAACQQIDRKARDWTNRRSPSCAPARSSRARAFPQSQAACRRRAAPRS